MPGYRHGFPLGGSCQSFDWEVPTILGHMEASLAFCPGLWCGAICVGCGRLQVLYQGPGHSQQTAPSTASLLARFQALFVGKNFVFSEPVFD